MPKTDDQYPLGVEYIRVIEYDEKTGLGIIRCNNRTVDIIRPSFEKITEASTNLLNAEVLGVSGTIKALRRKFLKFLRK